MFKYRGLVALEGVVALFSILKPLRTIEMLGISIPHPSGINVYAQRQKVKAHQTNVKRNETQSNVL
jgi:hypothetical protein